MYQNGIRGNLLSEYILNLLYEEIKGKYREKYRDFKGILGKASSKVKNEADIVDHIIIPVFIEILGYDYWHRERVSNRFRPDIEVYKGDKPVLLIEAKSVGVDFDRAVGGRSPARQVKNYLVDYEIRKTIRFGILSDGVRYRVYYGGNLEDFVEFDFSSLTGKADIFKDTIKTFEIFYHLLNAKDFPFNLDEVIYRSEGYRFKVSEDLTKKVFENVIPLIANEFYKQGEKDLNVLKEKTLIFLYRLLFLFYAEDRELLNLYGYSIKELRRKAKEGNFSENSYIFWERLKTVFKMVDEGDESLNISKYNGGLFRNDEFFDKYKLNDKVVAEVLRALSYYDDNYINYRTLSVRNLGSIYETILEYDLKFDGNKLVLAKGGTKRKLEGVYYTPDFVVKFIVENTLNPKIDEIIRDTEKRFKRIDDMGKNELLKEFKRLGLDPKEKINGKIRDKKPSDMREELKGYYDPVERILSLKVLDPAIGSGHFLVEVVSFLVDRILMVINRFEKEMNYRSRFADYDENKIKRIVLKRCVYGVDINPLAVELAKVSLWLHTFSTGLPLTFLDHHIKVGNSVYGYGFKERDYFGKSPAFQNLKKLIETINESNDASIEEVEKSEMYYKNFEKAIVSFRDELNKYIPNLNPELKPFHFIIEFPDIDKGFDVVLGNPPYIRQERLKGFKDSLKELFKDVYNSRADIYVYFYARGLELLKEGGYLGFITSNKFMRAGYGKELRRYISKNFKVVKVIDFSGYRVFKDATVDTVIFIIKKEKPDNNHNVEACEVSGKNLIFTEGLDYEEIEEYKKKGKETISIFEYFEGKKLPIPQNKAFKEEIFIIEDLSVLRLKEKIEEKGKPLKEWNVKIYFGIKTGLNEAFIITTEKRNEILNNCKDEDERKRTEAIIKPILRGRDIKRYYYEWAGLWVIVIPAGWTNENRGKEEPEIFIKETYPSLMKYLSNFEEKAKNRYDKGDYWWELRPCNYYHEFEKEKVVWQRITQEPTFCLVEPNIFILDSMAFLVGNNLKYVMALLNSKLIRKYVDMVVHQYGSKGFRLANQYVEIMPIPPITPANEPIVKQIEELVDKIITAKKQIKNADTTQLERHIDRLVYKLYDLTDEEIRIIERGI